MKRLLPILLLSLIPLAYVPMALAADGADTAEVPPPPPLIEGESATEALMEPDISIRKEADQEVEEYRIQGQLYMIKVTPKRGEPYYLVDADGDGELEHQMYELDPKFMIPSWTIFRW